MPFEAINTFFCVTTTINLLMLCVMVPPVLIKVCSKKTPCFVHLDIMHCMQMREKGSFSQKT